MGYTHNCDFCGERKDTPPPFIGELTETFLKTSDSPLTQVFKPGQTVTGCRQCAEEHLL
jgi:hypothetical protein